MFKVNNKTRHWRRPSVFIVNFELVNAGWEVTKLWIFLEKYPSIILITYTKIIPILSSI